MLRIIRNHKNKGAYYYFDKTIFHKMNRLILVICSFYLPFTVYGQERIDHVGLIKSLGDNDAKVGQAIYRTHCASCHGQDGELALNPLARRFAKDKLKFGSDPYSLWKTISYGNGLMFRWDTVLSAKERYQIAHFISERILKESNPGEYFIPDDEYYEKVPNIAQKDALDQASNKQKVQPAAGMIDGTGGKKMIYGPFIQHGVAFDSIEDKNAEYIPEVTEKGLIVDLPGDLVICYDAHRLSVSGLWRGKTANTEDTHHTSYKGGYCLRPGSKPFYEDIDTIGWSIIEPKVPESRDHFHYKGLFLNNKTVVLSYNVGGREVLESPSASTDGNIVWRNFQVGPGNKDLFCLVSDGSLSVEGGTIVQGNGNTKWLHIPASSNEVSVSVSLGDSPPITGEVNLDKHTKGGPRRWPQLVQTAMATGHSVDGYALDQFTVPLANPWGSWMRTTAMDFFSDGRMAVCTLSGDVWIVSWDVENPQALTWSRFAAGLYEPLGLKIVDDIIYVRGRDRITRLHDLNHNGEADYYENFYEEPNEIGASYHAFIYDLNTDKSGNFYFSQSGYKSPLTGAVVKVSSDGQSAEFIGTDLRNPNGMGVGGPKDWITVADNPSGKAVYNGFFLAKKGAKYGYQKSRTVPMLVRLPASVDSSSGSQCWSNPMGWGPLSGSVIHTSYSQCSVFYCFIQDVEPYPNGFAVRFPFNLDSGAMRPRVHPIDKQVYVTCHKGWDTKAPLDGVIYRFRYTQDPVVGICDAAVTHSGLRLTFASELDPSSVKPSAFKAYKKDDSKKGSESFAYQLGKVQIINPRTIEIEMPNIGEEVVSNRTNGNGHVSVNSPIVIEYKLKSKNGSRIEQTIYSTINSLPN